VSALRNATGRSLTRVPVRPDDIVFQGSLESTRAHPSDIGRSVSRGDHRP
jgi:hypothetical protein